jgi:acylphosphatase
MGDVVRTAMIRGVVQGVGYRAWLAREAAARGLEGWVRNRRDGRVEAVLAGPAETVAEMIELCRQGPAMAEVDAVEQRPVGAEALNARYSGERFSMLPTI